MHAFLLPRLAVRASRNAFNSPPPCRRTRAPRRSFPRLPAGCAGRNRTFSTKRPCAAPRCSGTRRGCSPRFVAGGARRCRNWHAVTLIPHALQQLQRPALARQPQRLFLSRPVDLLKFLRQPDDWNVLQPECRNSLQAAPSCPLPPSIRIKSGKVEGRTAVEGRASRVEGRSPWPAVVASCPRDLFFKRRRTAALVSSTSFCNSPGSPPHLPP